MEVAEASAELAAKGETANDDMRASGHELAWSSIDSHQMLAKWLDSELVGRLSVLNSKLDSLKQCVDECREGIYCADERKAGQIRRLIKANSKEVNVVSTPSPKKSEEESKEEAPPIISDKPRTLEVARWVEDAPGQPEVKPVVKSANAGSPQSEWEAMLDDPEYSVTAKFYTTGMPLFVCLSVVFTLLQTIQTNDGRVFGPVFAAVIEVTVESVLVADVVLRFLVTPIKARFCHNFHNIVDVLVAIPLILRISRGCTLSEEEMETFPGSLLLYVLPLLRLMKTLRGFKALNLIVNTVGSVYAETWPTMLALLYILLFWSTIIYYVEPRENIDSYPRAMWFVVVTMSTVGYGDISPSTGAGYAVAGVMVSTSIFVMALPLGIVGTAVSEVWGERHTTLLRQWARQRLAQWGYTAADIPRFLEEFDSDGSGELEFPEFCAMLDEMKLGMKADKMRELFDSFDEDKSGAIDSTEFICKLYPVDQRKKLGEAGEAATEAARQKMAVKMQHEAARREASKEAAGYSSEAAAHATLDASANLNVPGTPLSVSTLSGKAWPPE